MKSRTVVEGSQRTFVLVLDSGEEAFKAITAFSGAQNISGASVTAIGAFAQAKVGWFDFETKNYVPIAVETQCEVLSLLGDVARGDDGKASLHLHAVLGLKDGTVRGGHLLEEGATDAGTHHHRNSCASAPDQTPRARHRLDRSQCRGMSSRANSPFARRTVIVSDLIGAVYLTRWRTYRRLAALRGSGKG